MAWFLGQSIAFIVLAFLLGLLVGWLIWGRRWRTADAAQPGTAMAAASAPAASKPAPPVPAAAPEADAQPETDAQPEPEGAFEAESAPVLASVSEPEPEPEALPEPELEPALVAVSQAPPHATNPADVSTVDKSLPVKASTVDDDLERIEGVGSKLAAALRGAGLRTYADVAEADRATLEGAIEGGGLRFAPSLGTWSRQARLLADGDDQGFQELTARLIAGRDVTPRPDDDLQRIEGIGPRMSAALVGAGIRTYQRLAAADEATIRIAIEAAGLRFAPSLTTWARQARLLADGDEVGFADLTRRLVAGRDVGRV